MYSAENGSGAYTLGDVAEEDEDMDSKKPSAEIHPNGRGFSDQTPLSPKEDSDGRDAWR